MLTDKEKDILGKIFSEHKLESLNIKQSLEISNTSNILLRKIEFCALDNGIIPERYQRHILSLGIDGQKSLLESKVLVVGLGGLGGTVLEHLIRFGVGQIITADPDVFNESDLNRQILSNLENLGIDKTVEAEKRVKSLNTAIDFRGYKLKFEELPDEVWQGLDLVFDCLDSIPSRFVLAEKCSKINVPLVHGAIGGWCGQVAIIWPGSGTLNKLYSDNKNGLEKQLGTPSITAAITAGLMTKMAVKILTGNCIDKKQEVTLFDLLNDEFHHMNL